jgi:ABC-type multidrug transport system permease subunit
MLAEYHRSSFKTVIYAAYAQYLLYLAAFYATANAYILLLAYRAAPLELASGLNQLHNAINQRLSHRSRLIFH